MKDFLFPDYNNSILNLMASLKKGMGGKKSAYNELKVLKSKDIEEYDDIILLVIDGLGYNYLLNNNSFMKDNLVSSISSTFLSTTACANTVFCTGQSPNETGITGWFTYLRQMGVISAILPYFSMIGKVPLKDFANMDKFVNIKSIFSEIKAKSFAIIEDGLKSSEFNKLAYKGAKMIYRKSIKDAFKKVSELIRKKSRYKRFIHIYLSEFDHDSHQYGPRSREARKTFCLLIH
jgi:predicted AlkP superfamily pyrophosphatase or phosphodiesterase